MALSHIDAGVLIGLLDAGDAHHAGARSVIAEVLERPDRVAMAASALAEVLVGPARRGDEAIDVVHELCGRLPIDIVALDSEIATAAAHLRARHRSLRLPDALVIATASAMGADQLVTTDHGWPTAKALRLPLSIRTI